LTGLDKTVEPAGSGWIRVDPPQHKILTLGWIWVDPLVKLSPFTKNFPQRHIRPQGCCLWPWLDPAGSSWNWVDPPYLLIQR